AGCDKVLIYRYFGGLDGVLAALGAERQLWPRVGESDEEGLAEAVRAVLLEEWAALAAGGLERESAAAEVGGAGALAGAVARQRAESHERIVAALRAAHRIPAYVDLAALVEVLSAALTMFALRSPATPEGWRRVEKTLGAVLRAMLGAGD
ncbi:MAG: hypothetical protein ACRENC_10335, partial [Gemmatimonadaceae bacterium]